MFSRYNLKDQYVTQNRDSGLRLTSTYKNGSQAPATTTFPTPFYNQRVMPGTATTSTDHIFAQGLPLATIEQVGTGNPTIFWNHDDHLGGTTVVTDQAGVVQERTTYQPFGTLKSDIGTHTEQRKYTSHELDTVSTYTYAEARYLDTDWGRFLMKFSL